ncbi:MAG: hypothetical protein Q8S15_01615 [Erysipelotrichaceae bacterium]|nr:hypothetical protein [Erysipelotrichaceae bacterium]
MDNLKKITLSFVDQLDSLMEYISSIAQTLDQIGQKFREGSDEKAILDSMKILSLMVADFKADPGLFLSGIHKTKKKNGSDFFPDEYDNDPEKIVRHFVELFSSSLCKFEFDGDKLTYTLKDYKLKVLLQEAMKRQKSIGMQVDMFAHSSLLTLVNNYEYLVSQVFSDIIVTKFETIEIDKKTISFNDLMKIGDIDEAKSHLIMEIINDQMRKSNVDWIKAISKYTNTKMHEKLTSETSIVNEIFQRRHIIVHNGGVVNAYYMSNVVESLRKDVKKGKKIQVSREYVENSIRNILILGLSVIFYYWQHIEPQNYGDRFSLFHNIAYDKLKANNLITADLLFDLINTETNKFNGEDKLLHCINASQTKKWLGDKNYAKKLNETDFSLAHDNHKMCIAILNDNFDEANKHLKKIIESKDHKDHEFSDDLTFYLDWPIFREYQKSEQFKILVKELGYEEVAEKS